MRIEKAIAIANAIHLWFIYVIICEIILQKYIYDAITIKRENFVIIIIYEHLFTAPTISFKFKNLFFRRTISMYSLVLMETQIFT